MKGLRLPRPTAAGTTLAVGAVVFYIGGVVLGYQSLVALAAAAAVAMIGGALLATWRPRMELARSFHPQTVTAGEPAVALLQVDNRSNWPSTPVTVVDRVAEGEVRLAVRAMRPGGSSLLRYPLPTERRGRIVLGPMTVARADPLGLMVSHQEYRSEEILWVHPRTWRMDALPSGFVADLEGPVTESALSGSLTFSSLREYVPGDDRRQIHWRSSARLGTLVVRQHVDTNEPRAAVLIDTRAAMWTDDSFEHGVEIAGSLVAGLASDSHSVELHIPGLSPARARDLGASTIADRLAAAERINESSPVALLGPLAQERGGGSLVVVSGLMEPEMENVLSRQGNRFSPIIICSIAPGMSAVWRRHRGVTLVRGPDARSLALAWNRMARQ